MDSDPSLLSTLNVDNPPLAKVLEELNRRACMRASLESRFGPEEHAMNHIRVCICYAFVWIVCLPLIGSSPTSRNTANSTNLLEFPRNYIQLHELEEHQGNLHVICTRVGICSQNYIGNFRVMSRFVCYCCAEGYGILIPSSGFLFSHVCN